MPTYFASVSEWVRKFYNVCHQEERLVSGSAEVGCRIGGSIRWHLEFEGQ